MRVLLTGGAGFIGSHVSERLVERGDEVIIVDSFDPFYSPEVKRRNIETLMSSGGATLIEADIADTAHLDEQLGEEEIHAIIHLAARAGVRPSLERPLDYVRTNVEGTQSMLELARRRGVRSFVMGSSSSVYGDSTPVPFSESEPADQPISPYAATKRAAELFCHAHAHLYGSSVACLRLFTVYGPRQRPDLAIHKFARLMSRGSEIPLFGDGTTERDYTYISDIVQGIEGALAWTLAAPPGAFECINLGESRTISLSELVDILSAELGVAPRIKRLPAQPGDVQRTFADVAKARTLLGYDPQTPIEAGIRRFVDWFRAQQPADARSSA
ncbi:MAG TPA: NAD-dependent epimerase/dehydratase family protein [Gemmatimonadaceae bacterium]|nr:NAD-dependent epimerase/dehydratase family protein [Gemmatimonadaceae bacterium]